MRWLVNRIARNTMAEKLSESLEDYLETIAHLIEIEGHAHTKKIAESLNVKMPSVTAALKQLANLGYIHYSTHFPVELTVEGKRIADEVIRRHEVLTRFFAGILGLNSQQASETACRMEHLVDDSTIERFVLFSDALTKRADAQELRVYLMDALRPENKDARLLSDMPIGSMVTVSYIGRNVKNCPLSIDDVIKVGVLSLDASSITLEKDGEEINIPRQMAENIWCNTTQRF